MHLLEQDLPGVAGCLHRLPDSRRRGILSALVSDAAVALGPVDEAITDAASRFVRGETFSQDQRNHLKATAESADNQYFTLQESGAPMDQWTTWFRAARLATAISSAVNDPSCNGAMDAIYELMHASADPSEFLQSVRRELFAK